MAERGRITIVLVLWIASLYSNVARAEAVPLQFRPEIGAKQTVRITTVMASTPAPPASPENTERSWALTLKLEPAVIAGDGAVTLRVTLLRIESKLLASGIRADGPLFSADSADETSRDEYGMGKCLAPIGESFTVIVSARGRIVKVDSEAFCVAVARKRIQYEDEAIRREATRFAEWRTKDKGKTAQRLAIKGEIEEAFRKEYNKYGSAAKREERYREEAMASELYSLVQLQRTLSDALIPFPDEPVAKGERWTAPVLVCTDGPIELTGTYTLTDQDNSTCTIQIEAQRTMDDQSMYIPEVPDEYRTRLAGTYRATVKIDRTTGVLLSKEASMDLTGRISTFMPDGQVPPRTFQIVAKSTNTVEVMP